MPISMASGECKDSGRRRGGDNMLPPFASPQLEALDSLSEVNELVGLLEVQIWRTAIWGGKISKGKM